MVPVVSSALQRYMPQDSRCWTQNTCYANSTATSCYLFDSNYAFDGMAGVTFMNCTVSLNIVDEVATVTLIHHGKFNAMSRVMWRHLVERIKPLAG
ncbi:hypothetical protein Pnap_4618 (plasmid) [Polaromonas naphthalenivorans CJ2]|uniref:Uncharacterized protein n=1 Tax=Polaromonas naphthalenivorans (strain CJ2) TaxID=365044 RepID=A1VWL1_POLNA|nr:hypothetical protein Pnap_4618 [Polaromonas naphthalenivorans CJ2]